MQAGVGRIGWSHWVVFGGDPNRINFNEFHKNFPNNLTQAADFAQTAVMQFALISDARLIDQPI